MNSKALALPTLVICYIINSCLIAQQLQVSNYALKHYTPADGLGSTQTRGIIQDSLGYIWIASGIGLSRYDGYNFKSYKFDPDNNLRSAFGGGISWLWIDRSGQLWIISDILSRYDSKTDNFIHYRPDLDPKDVFRFCFEKDGPVVWMGTHTAGLYSFNSETKKTSNYLRSHADSLMKAKMNSVWGISDRGSSLLVATRQGLWTFDKVTGNFRRPECDPKDSTFLFDTSIWHIIDWPHFDPDDTWLVLESGLVKVNRQLSIVHRFDYPDGFRTNNYRRDAQGIFWLMDFNNRLHRYNPFDGSFNLVEIKTGNQPFIFERDFWIDRNETIWSGSEADGAYQLIRQSLSFYNFNFPSRAQWNVSSLYHANKKERLVLTKAVGGYNELWTAFPILNEKMDSVEFQKLKMNKPLQGFTMSTTVGKNTLWVCSWNTGITGIHIGKSGLIEPDNRFALKSDPENPNTVNNDKNAFVYFDDEENLWIVSRGNGLSKIVLSKPYGSEGSLLRYKHVETDSNSLNHNYSLRIYPEGEKSLWIVTWGGMDLFRDGVFHHVFKNKATPRTVLKSSDGNLLIGTMGGLYHATKTGDDYYVQETPTLQKYVVEDILEDQQQRLWLADPLADRLVCYDRKEKVAIEFHESDGLPTGVTDFMQTSKGVMVLTSINGFSMFDPLALQIKKTGTLPVLTGLTVNNLIPRVGGEGNTNDEFSIATHISELKELILDHRHNNFAIEFSCMEMIAPDKNLYRHMLEGFDKEWIETDSKNRIASYTNLDAGTYHFRVRASNHQGIWSNKERTLTIRILPPPWKTWWAYTLYGIALIVMFLSWRNYENKRVKLKHRAEHLSELDNLKTRFFTNISHEFRTPITLILGPLKEMYNKASDEERSAIGIMLRNAKRLARLINQLLDLSKLEAGKMIVSASPVELVQFLRDIASSYESQAAYKKIKYVFHTEVTELIAYIDAEKMGKVVHNLLSNAFKFTNEGGQVVMNLKLEGKQCRISVKDTGIGIPTHQINKIFDRFYQIDSSQTREYEGSGLGMTLAKELVELHHGTLTVESTEGQGTIFTVRLPLSKVHLRSDEIIDVGLKKSETYFDDLTVVHGNDQHESENAIEPSAHQPILLIVEDNADMRHYIRKIFSDQYQILEGTNGKEGIAKSQEIVPDLIISDIMMPEMDGYKFCEQIKTNELTSHIPVIVLTAKADQESKLTGLETGADDYLAKPFDADELVLIVRNRLEHRRKLRERFSREITLEPQKISITSFDEKFLTRVLTIIETHIGDENFTIEELCLEVGYSNMHLSRKLKALAGETPSQFLRTIRLKRAAEMLRMKSDNVTQIAYSVGFNSLPYFIKCFKEQFGQTPGQFSDKSIPNH